MLQTVFTVLDTHFRSNRGLCKPPNDATPPSVDPVEALETDEEAQRAAQAIRKAYLSEGPIRTMTSLFYGSVASGMWQDLDGVPEEHEL